MEKYSKLELIYKVTPMLCKYATRNARGYSGEVELRDLLRLCRTSSTKPKDIFNTSQQNINKAENQLKLAFDIDENRSPRNTMWRYIIHNQTDLDCYIEIHDTLEQIANNDDSKDPISLLDCDFSYGTIRRFIEAKNAGLKFKTLIDYIFYQCDHTQALTANSAIITLTDYYRLVSHLPKYRKYPKYLKTSHDVASRNYKLTESDAMKIGIEKTYVKNSNLEMILGDYIFTLPKQASDLAEEGAMMSNCVAGYATNVSNGSTTIVFMRDKKKPNDSLITVEVRGGNIVQAYAAYNRTIGDKDLIGMVKWAKANSLGVLVYKNRLEAAEDAAKKLRWKAEEVNSEAA